MGRAGGALATGPVAAFMPAEGSSPQSPKIFQNLTLQIRAHTPFQAPPIAAKLGLLDISAP